MANATYVGFREGIMGGDVDLNTAVIKVAVVRAYTFDPTDVYMSDVASGGGVTNATSSALTNCVVTGGVFDADDTTITLGVDPSNHTLIIFQASAVTGGADVAPTAQRLICHMDTGTGLPVVPATGGVITITWPSSAGKIIKIG